MMHPELNINFFYLGARVEYWEMFSIFLGCQLDLTQNLTSLLSSKFKLSRIIKWEFSQTRSKGQAQGRIQKFFEGGVLEFFN